MNDYDLDDYLHFLDENNDECYQDRIEHEYIMMLDDANEKMEAKNERN